MRSVYLIDGRFVKMHRSTHHNLFVLALYVAGLTAESPETWQVSENEQYWDDVNGGFLDGPEERTWTG